MAEPAKIDVETAARPRRRGAAALVAGLAAMLALGAGGFHVTWSGLVELPLATAARPPSPGPGAGPVFVPVEQLTVSLGPNATARHARISAVLEVEPGREREVAELAPRILDVMNTYMQALDESDLERPAAMARMRAHLLRRIRIVAGEDRVRDLLITEFILQ